MPELSNIDMKREHTRRRAFAMPVVIALFATLSVGIFSLWFITRQERGASQNFIVDTKAALLADAIHVFLTAQAYTVSWNERFFKDRQTFPVAAAAAGSWADQLQSSVARMYKSDPWLAENFDYRGEISSAEKDNQKIIIISVIIENRKTGESVCRHKYYEVYKRDLIDTVGEGVGLFVDETESGGNGSELLPPELNLK